jgi:excisionase family DNA binding protein
VNSKNKAALKERIGMDGIERLLGPKEIGEILSLKRTKVHQMLATGEIPSVIVSKGAERRVFRVKPSALQQWMKQREVSQQAGA